MGRIVALIKWFHWQSYAAHRHAGILRPYFGPILSDLTFGSPYDIPLTAQCGKSTLHQHTGVLIAYTPIFSLDCPIFLHHCQPSWCWENRWGWICLYIRIEDLTFTTEVMFRGQDAWRRHPLLTGCSRNPLPGLGTALVIFAGYCVAEAGYNYVTGSPNLHFTFRIILKDIASSDETFATRIACSF